MVSDDAGYATPAAVVISFAIAMVVTSVTARAMSELKLAKADLARTQADYALSAAAQAALVAIATSDQAPPYRWTQASLGKAYDMIAEPERLKLSPSAMADQADETFAALGVSDPGPVRDRLRALTVGRHLAWMMDQADATTWKSCAATFVSSYGAATSLQIPSYRQPNAGAQSPHFRAGERWRLRARDPDGWQDERVVQLTGDGLNPAAVIDRRLSRTSKGDRKCEDLLGASSVG